jgi:hypothetical protein
METIIIIAAIIISTGLILYRKRGEEQDKCLNGFTLNLLQEKTRQSDNYQRLFRSSVTERLKLEKALRIAEEKNEKEFKRGYDNGYDARDEELRAGTVELADELEEGGEPEGDSIIAGVYTTPKIETNQC